MRAAWASALGVLTATTPAVAQTMTDNEAAFSVERFAPAPGPGPFLAVEDADVHAHLDWSFGVVGSLMTRPIVFTDIFDGEEVTEPVRVRLGYDLLGAVGLGTRYQVGLALPIVAAQDGDRLRGIGLDEQSLDPFAVGDLRLHLKMRLVGKPGAGRGGVAVAAQLSMPTGDEHHFAGEKGAVVEWRLIGSWRAPWWSVAVNAGPRLRTREVVLLSPSRPHGNEIVASFAAEGVVPMLPRRALRVVAEYQSVWADKGAAGRGPSPHEARAGLRWHHATGWSLMFGAGFGTTPDDVGSPAWRVFAGTRWSSSPTSDIDGDGLRDGVDRCRLAAEDRDGFRDTDGCPDPDNDGDTIPDADDRCPDAAEDPDGYRDLDGCPETETRM